MFSFSRIFAISRTALLLAGIGIASGDTLDVSLSSPLTPGGSVPVLVNLNGVTTPSQTTLIGTGYTITFSGVDADQGIVQGQIPLVHDIPVAGVTGVGSSKQLEYLTGGFGSSLTTDGSVGGASGNYFSTGLGTITITFASPQDSLALLWGSVDGQTNTMNTRNTLSFNDAANFSVTGTQVKADALSMISKGFQSLGDSAYVVVDTTTPFTTVTATSSIVSFEFAGVVADNQSIDPNPNIVTIPEPGSLVLFGLGIGLIAGLRFSRRYLSKIIFVSPVNR
jgi:hypothetical protein